MKTYNASEKVGYGLYVSPKAFDVAFVGSDNETLAGKRGRAYYRLPMTLMILSAPVLGGLFVMAFPVIVLMMVIAAIGRLAYNTVASVAQSKSHLLEMNWQPSAAYLNKNKPENTERAREKSSELKDLHKEVQEARKREK